MMLMVQRDRMKKNADKHRRHEVYKVGDRVMLSSEHLQEGGTKLSDRYVGPFPITEVMPNGVSVKLRLPRQYRRLHQPFHVEKLKRFNPSVVEWGRKQNDRPLPELVDGEPMWEVEMLLGKQTKEEMVELRPTAAVESQVLKASEGKEESDEGEGHPVRRSTRLREKQREMTSASPAASQRAGAKKQRKPARVRQLVTRYLVKWKGYDEDECSWEEDAMLRLHAQEAVDEYERRMGELRGEAVVGVQCVHTLAPDVSGVSVLNTVWVSAPMQGCPS